MNIEEKISKDIKMAMIGKDTNRLRALRGIKSQLEILNSNNSIVTEEMRLPILQKMIKQRKESSEIYKVNNREDLLKIETDEISVIEEFLPIQLTNEEVEVEVKQIINRLKATSIRDMGKVMGLATKTLAGKADNKVVSEIVKSILVC